MSNDLCIFICAHEKFLGYPRNKEYAILNYEKYNNSTIKVLDNDLTPFKECYGEGYHIYWIWQNINKVTEKYIGFCQYKKYFDFYNKIPDVSEIMNEYDVITGEPIEVHSNYSLYNSCHYGDDLTDVVNIIKQYYPKYYMNARKFLMDKKFYIGNIFIMNKKDFIEYCTFAFGVLDKYNKMHNLTCKEDVINMVNSRYKEHSNEYQYKIHGFLLERLTNIYYAYKGFNIKTFPIKYV